MLRLGHVYGAGIGRSREIIELARDARFRLPYGGRFHSNAIHIDRVASAVLELLGTNGSSEVYGLAEPHTTWREIFDWHTESLGLPAVAAMNDGDSDEGRDSYARRSLVRDVGGWLRALPVKQLLRTPAMLDLALRVMVRTPTAMTKRVTDVHRRVAVRKQVALAMGGSGEALSPIYYSAGMPGPFLRIPDDGAGSDGVRRQELRDWYLRWSTPKLHARPLVSFARRREGERS